MNPRRRRHARMRRARNDNLGKWVIEFRNGRFFQNLAADRSGPARSAARFMSRRHAWQFMRDHEWILFNGGMVMLAAEALAIEMTR